MNNLLLIALGGAGGALCRHGLVNLISSMTHTRFPYGTLTVNIVGSFCIGIMYVLIAERMSLHPDWRNIAMVGFLGAFTTFSTFSLETIKMLENGQIAAASLYVGGSLLLCIVCAWLGLILARLT